MDIKNERREYLRSGLSRQQLATDPVEQFEHWLQEAKDHGIKDPTAMMLATVDATGQPSQRTVLLKQFDSSGFVFYTNLESNKAKQIADNNRVSLIFPWLTMERQVMISGRAERVSTKEALAYFVTRPRDSQLAAWVSKQSSPIGSRELLMGKFAEIKQRFAQQDLSLPKFWGGFRVVPERVEFWAGGAQRLHDRFEYLRDNEGAWNVERLQP
ncbi:pyridoxamine 5'-phosphate oxidase [Sinobacterium caligoides]|uniref:Pyridoxine/pyridoxamine 5'-phosphate oxidase n=1 Tax=Sinobacterium caligoides TaxID=933926 RepID=A0A3N2DZD6_9GAMM|nr:pyridoxamine 5'-phosphate oxidase [Sinobacterium caligoides]ROS05200.1 pyridoxamine 5'-phosphate oxidase [Sinobacterium caligoides]